jgi:hypothetical protein
VKDRRTGDRSDGLFVVVDGEVLGPARARARRVAADRRVRARSHKGPGDEVLSGSFVVAGSGSLPRHAHRRRLVRQPALAEGGPRFKLAHSELRDGHQHDPAVADRDHPAGGVAAAAALLLRARTTLAGGAAGARSPPRWRWCPTAWCCSPRIAFVVGVLALARRKALAKELASVELLARVDTLCLDKTGTITTGEISFGEHRAARRRRRRRPRPLEALGAVAAADPNPNATLAGHRRRLPRARRLGSRRRCPVLLGPQVGGGVVRRPRHLGARRPRHPAARRTPGATPGATGSSPRRRHGRRVLVLLAHADAPLGDRCPSRATFPSRSSCSRTRSAPTRPRSSTTSRAGRRAEGDLRRPPRTVAAVAERAGVPGAERPSTPAAARGPRRARRGARGVTDGVRAGHPHQKRAMVARLQRLLAGVPMPWMTRWPGAFPLFVDRGPGRPVHRRRRHEYVDFCLGDTGAMTGHGLPQVAERSPRRPARASRRCCRATDAAWVAGSSPAASGSPVADGDDRHRRQPVRAALRPHLTGRPKICVMDWCYHGTVDETLVILDESTGRGQPSRRDRPAGRSRDSPPGWCPSTTSRPSSRAGPRRRRLRADGARPHQHRHRAARARLPRGRAGGHPPARCPAGDRRDPHDLRRSRRRHGHGASSPTCS